MGGGVMTSMRMRLVPLLTLFRYVLVRYIGGEWGDGGGGDDVHANALCLLFLLLTLLRYEHDNVAPCWPCCKVTFETLPVAL